MKSSIKALMEGEKTVQEILRDHLVLITCVGDKPPNKETTICKDLIDLVIEDLRRGDNIPRMCYFDKESNTIKNGINFRSPDGNE